MLYNIRELNHLNPSKEKNLRNKVENKLLFVKGLNHFQRKLQ